MSDVFRLSLKSRTNNASMKAYTLKLKIFLIESFYGEDEN